MNRRTLLRLVGATSGVAFTTGGPLAMLSKSPADQLDQLRQTTADIRAAMAAGSQSTYLPRLREHVATITDLLAAAGPNRDRHDVQAALAQASVLHATAAGDAAAPAEMHLAASTATHAAISAGDRDGYAVGWIWLAACKLNGYQDSSAAVRCAARGEDAAESASLKAWAACTAALASGARGATADTLEALDRAAAYAARGEDAGVWHSQTTPDHVTNFAGVLQARLGRAEQGEATLRPLVMGEVFDSPHQQIHLMTDLVEVYMLLDEPEGAALTAQDALAHAVALHSDAKVRRIRQVTEPLGAYIGVPAVNDLDAALASTSL